MHRHGVTPRCCGRRCLRDCERGYLNNGSAHILDDMKALYLMLLVALLMTVGCGSSTEKRTFDINVRNATDKTITIWLTKDGPPNEKGWGSPEQIAVAAPPREERISGVVVPPGKTAYTGVLEGEFEYSTAAVLRVYDGQYPEFSDLLAVPPNSPLRTEHVLYEGKNLLVVKRQGGKLIVENEGIPMSGGK